MAKPQGAFYAEMGRRIAKFRNEHSLSQLGLARALDLSRTSVTNIEKGRQPVQAHVLVHISEILGVPLGELIPSAAPAKKRVAMPTQFKPFEPDTQVRLARMIAGDKENSNVGQIQTRTTASDGTAAKRQR